MINPVSAYTTTAPLPSTRATAATPTSGGTTPTTDSSDRLTISSEGYRRAAAGTTAAEQTGNPFAARADGSLPPLITDYNQLVGIAESRLKELMGQLGINPDTPATLTEDGSGNIAVAIDHPRAKELEELANNDQVLRNGVIGAATMARVSRIAAAQQMAGQAIDANPESADRCIDWLMKVSRQATNMDVRFQLADGKLSGSLITADGRPLGITEGLSVPS
ncbi:hypothetical protein [Endothiovibrio diazotrophicus]